MVKCNCAGDCSGCRQTEPEEMLLAAAIARLRPQKVLVFGKPLSGKLVAGEIMSFLAADEFFAQAGQPSSLYDVVAGFLQPGTSSPHSVLASAGRYLAPAGNLLLWGTFYRGRESLGSGDRWQRWRRILRQNNYFCQVLARSWTSLEFDQRGQPESESSRLLLKISRR